MVGITTDYVLDRTHCCDLCQSVLPLTAFDVHSSTGRIRNTCKACRLAQIGIWQTLNREQTRINQRNYNRRTRGRAFALLNQAKIRSAKRGQECLLTLDHVLEGLERGYCAKTFVAFDLEPYGDNHQSPFGPSIDKINPKGIYEPKNVQYVCFWYNSAKQQWPEDVLIQMCQRVVLVNDLSR